MDKGYYDCKVLVQTYDCYNKLLHLIKLLKSLLPPYLDLDDVVGNGRPAVALRQGPA